MPLKRAAGNMYPWVTHTHSHLGGRCAHDCSYCYVDHPRWGRPPRYEGEIRLIESEFRVKYDDLSLWKDWPDHPATACIFVEHMNDLFAASVPDAAIKAVLDHCHQWPQNTYCFQTKNPARLLDFLHQGAIPHGSVFGTTIESNRRYPEMGKAPAPAARFMSALALLRVSVEDRFFVTVEPIMDFDVEILAEWIGTLRPDWLNIGADSKGHNLPEPPMEKVERLIESLKQNYGIEVREKHNLGRLRL